jgi:hypothetical protein
VAKKEVLFPKGERGCMDILFLGDLLPYQEYSETVRLFPTFNTIDGRNMLREQGTTDE